jgi:hypothetical protein
MGHPAARFLDGIETTFHQFGASPIDPCRLVRQVNQFDGRATAIATRELPGTSISQLKLAHRWDKPTGVGERARMVNRRLVLRDDTSNMKDDG